MGAVAGALHAYVSDNYSNASQIAAAFVISRLRSESSIDWERDRVCPAFHIENSRFRGTESCRPAAANRVTVAIVGRMITIDHVYVDCRTLIAD